MAVIKISVNQDGARDRMQDFPLNFPCCVVFVFQLSLD